MLDTTAPKNRPSTAPGDLEAILGIGEQAPRRFLRWRNLAWAAVAATAIVGLYALWSLGGSRAAVTYVTEPAMRGSMTVIVTATGSAQPITQVNISSELSGTMRNVFVDYNSPVKAGQALAELDTDKLKATVENSKAKLASTKAKVADAAASIEEKRAEYERKKALSTTAIASIRDLELAKANYDRAVAQHALAVADVAAAEAELRLNEINLAKGTIRSPIDGVVLKRGVDPGQFVATSLQAPVLFVIAEDLRRMEVLVDVDEADVGKVRVGQTVSFSVDAYPDRKFPAEIRDIRFGSEVVQGVVTYKAVLSIDNSDLMIRPGMTATAEIVVQQVKDALLVPNPALRFSPAATQTGGQQQSLLQRLFSGRPTFRPPSKQEETGASRTVWVLRDGAPIRVPVVIGATDGRRTEIVKGDIAADQRVIVDAVAAKR
jgi:HlyD family secretion protein